MLGLMLRLNRELFKVKVEGLDLTLLQKIIQTTPLKYLEQRFNLANYYRLNVNVVVLHT